MSTGRLLVLACRRCRRARIVEAHRKTTQCATCNAKLHVDARAALFATDSDEEARLAVGRVNARLAGRPDEFQPEDGGPRPRVQATLPTTVADDAPSGLTLSGPVPKAASQRTLEEVAQDLGEFTREDLEAALEDEGLKMTASDALKRLLAVDAVYEPTPGRYRVL